MASAQANAERFARARQAIHASMERLSRDTGVPMPPPATKTDTREAMAAVELDRVAIFMTQLSGMEPPGADGFSEALGGIGDGYNDIEAKSAADREEKKPKSKKTP